MPSVDTAMRRLRSQRGRGSVRAAYDLVRRSFDEGRPDVATAALAHARLRVDEDPEGGAWLMLGEALTEWQAGRVDAALAHQARGMAALEEMGDRRSLVLALLNDAGVRSGSSRGGAQQRLDRALREARILGDDELSARCHFSRAFHLTRQGRPDRVLVEARVGAWLAHRSGTPAVEAMCWSQLGAGLQNLGDPAGAEDAYRHALACLEGQPDSRLRADYLMSVVEAQVARGALDAAALTLDELDRTQARHLTGRLELGRDAAAGELALVRGDLPRAEALLQGALHQAERLEETAAAAVLRTRCARLVLAQGRAQQVVAMVDDLAHDPFPRAAAEALAVGARAHAALGDVDTAVERIGRAVVVARGAHRLDLVQRYHELAVDILGKAWRHGEALAHARAAASAAEASARQLLALHREADDQILALEDEWRTRQRRVVPAPRPENDEVGLVLATIAHELRTPLATVKLAVDAIESGVAPDRAAGHARSAVESADKLIEDLLRSYRSGSRQLVWTPGGVPLAPLLDEAIARHRSSAETKAIPLDLRVLQPVTVAADLLALREILDNLLSNAIKFSPPGGAVLVRCGRDGTRGWLAVEDQGPGIPRSEQAMLFQRFRRLSPRPTAGEPSTGLGLYLVRSLAEQMGGTARCESEPGEGSIFTVVLDRVAGGADEGLPSRDASP